MAASRTTILTTLPVLAPSAMRTPISWIRWLTKNAITP
jgi:hypothetical protein